jgi:FlaA1/EpsC-like NDP-sugar epimerase
MAGRLWGGGLMGASGRWRPLSVAASRIRADLAFAVVDLVAVVAAYSIGLGLRMMDPLVGDPREYWYDLLLVLPLIVVVHLAANAIAGAYGHVWEFASLSEAVRLIVANAAASAVVVTAAILLRGPLSLSMSGIALVAGGFVSLVIMGLIRFRSRLFSYRRSTGGPRTIVVGSGQDAAVFARRAQELEGGPRVVGFIGRGNGHPGRARLLAELPVLGGLDSLPEIVQQNDVDQVVVASRDPSLVKAVVDACLEVEVRLRILPAVEEVLQERTAPLDLRDIRVEDLLSRDPVATDMSAVARLIEGKRILVTGAGGSIGSEIVRQILKLAPSAVFALDRDETLLHQAGLLWPGSAQSVLASIRDAETLIRIFESLQPDIVFHAAALKHVPVLEHFPEEAVLTNVVGTRNLIEAGSRVGVERFVLISTDKAVDPTSVMGATKRVAELLIKAGNERQDGCRYTAVRFGNVLGSRGSVIPTFVSQIRSGGPVTVTDPEMTRYFMTVDEAVQLVLQSATLARDSEIFLLDMGEPVRIDYLARRLIRLAGLIPDVDVSVKYTGVRPGEKLHEELSNGPVEVTSHPQIFEVPLSHPGAGILAEAVFDLEECALAGEIDEVLQLLASLANGSLKNRAGVVGKQTEVSV